MRRLETQLNVSETSCWNRLSIAFASEGAPALLRAGRGAQ